MLSKLKQYRNYFVHFFILTLAFGLLYNAGPSNIAADSKIYGDDYPIQLLNDRAVDIVGARPLIIPRLISPTGLTGQGQIVGMADSGLDNGNLKALHPDLQTTPNGEKKVLQLLSWAGRATADDPVGHGTHMAATVVGTGAASNGQYQGIAPGAQLYFQALLNSKNKLQAPKDLNVFWKSAYDIGVRIHINGWGSGQNYYGERTQQIDQFAHKNPDFLPIFAAGNNGPNGETLTTEANSKNALVVGASQSPRPALTSEAENSEKAASFSSRGPTDDGRLKPDLVAPGSAIISAASRQITGNYPPNKQYTQMEGSSMAAAVAGGAATLLREWFQTSSTLETPVEPSSALIKAALINGARLPSGGPNTTEGFGIIDLSNTVFSLQEEGFLFQDADPGVTSGKSVEYQFPITDSSQPLKITLVWTDAPAKDENGNALVHDLDLRVIGPKGEQYLGNAAIHESRVPDSQNNVEQVVVPNPAKGVYRIVIQAKKLNGPETTSYYLQKNETEESFIQSFALVYGQPVLAGTIAQVNTQWKAHLTSGAQLDLRQSNIHLVINGELEDSTTFTLDEMQHYLPGAQVYQGKQGVYLISRTWQAEGVQELPTNKGQLFMEINPDLREGGFYLDSASKQLLSINGKLVSAQKAEIPAGVEIKASLNPFSQTLWKVALSFVEKKGVVSKVDCNTGEIWLGLDPLPYYFTPKTTLTFSDQVVAGSAEGAAYGANDNPGWEQILPGMQVKLVLSSQTKDQIQYLSVQRDLALGQITHLDIQKGILRLDNSQSSIFVSSTAQLWRDQESVQLTDLQVGDYLTAVIIGDVEHSYRLMQAQVYSKVSFGRVLYWREQQQSLDLVDANNQAVTYQLSNQTELNRRGVSVETGVLQPDAWVRITQNPKSGSVWRIDLADILRNEEKVVQFFRKGEEQLVFQGGSSVFLNPGTIITKGDYRVGLEDLVPGEKLHLIWLASLLPNSEYLAAIEVKSDSNLSLPRLGVAAKRQDQYVQITGHTSTENLYIYYGQGQRERIPAGKQGYFVWYQKVQPTDTLLYVVAIDEENGSLAAEVLDVPALEPFGFRDLDQHWASKEIVNLSLRGGISGYPDGTFRPNEAVNRAEVAAILVRLLGWIDSSTDQKTGTPKAFIDEEQIPLWAKSAVLAAQAQGVLQGYPDGSFQPQQNLNRSELAFLVYQLLSQRDSVAIIQNETMQESGSKKTEGEDRELQLTSASSFSDLTSLSPQQKAMIQIVCDRGIMFGLSRTHFGPDEPVTRGDLAAAFYYLLAELEAAPKNP